MYYYFFFNIIIIIIIIINWCNGFWTLVSRQKLDNEGKLK